MNFIAPATSLKSPAGAIIWSLILCGVAWRRRSFGR
jgi:hypothetical protein